MSSVARKLTSAKVVKALGAGPRSREKGVILVAVLWICALIMWFALQIAAETRLRGDELIHVTRKSQAFYLAIGGCYEALARMGQPPPLLAEEPSDLNWQPDGVPRVVRYDTGVAIVVVEPEEKKVNVNRASPQQLMAVFEKAGVDYDLAEKLADLIADFVDKDDTPHLHGGEKNAYRKAGLFYEPFNGPLTSLDQLLLIPGITQELFYGYVRSGGEEGSEIFRDLLVPSKDSLFSQLTIYGKNVIMPRTEEGQELDPRLQGWRQGGIYRILSFGKSFNGPPSVCCWMVVNLAPDGKNPYRVLHRKIL